MLQQTQVQRVIPKYQEFLRAFPSIRKLADAELGDVLRAWSGLGYNRRSKFLHQAAQKIASEHTGVFPADKSGLVGLPGIGENTAGAILAYAFNLPGAFVETNIRTVIIHHFFNDHADIPDKDILEVAAQALDHEHPREWYWALMDYGSYLKQTVGNLNRQSKAYTKQSTFVGSKRQLRGKIIALLSAQPMTAASLKKTLNDPRFAAVIDDLLLEGLIRQANNGRLSL